MRLSTLTLQGFKSFGNRTTLHFSPGVTAIVGPNGSGKSNLIDALRWTTGGGRAQSFRADDKRELIFHGAAGKRGLGYAEVEVELTDGSRSLRIFRSIDRDGTTRLRLNGRAARFLDVEEALAGSGLGRSSVAVIGQGEVSGVLMADPVKLLGYVAEAAGVARLSARRDQALARLETARGHLARLDDLMNELGRQLERLEHEAQAAARHQQLRREELQLRFTLAVRREASLADEIGGLRERQVKLEAQLERSREELEQARTTLLDSRNAARAADETYRRLTTEAERLRGELRLAEAHRAELERNAAALRERRTAVAGELAALGELTPPTAPPADEQVERDAAAISAAHEHARAALEEAERRRDEARERLAQLERAAAAAEQAAVAATTRRRELEAEIEALAAANSPTDVAAAAARAAAEAEAAAARLAACDAELQRAATTREARQREHAEAAAEAAALARAAERARAALAARRGYAAGPRNALTSGVPGVHGSVADLLRVPAAYREAIAAALGRRAEYVVVDSADTATVVLEHVRKLGGRVTLLPLDLLRPRSRPLAARWRELPGVIGPADEVVDVADAYRAVVVQLLGGTLLLDSLEAAVAVARRERNRPRLVTLDGDILEASGAICGGAKPSGRQGAVSVLGAAADAEEAEAAAAAAAERAAAAATALEAAERSYQQARGALLEAQQAAAAAREAHHRLHEQARAAEQLAADREARLQGLRAALADLEHRPEGAASEVDAAALEAAAAALAAAEDDYATAREAFVAAADAAAAAAGRLAAVREQRHAYTQALERYQHDLARRERLQHEAERLDERLVALAAELEEATAAVARAREALPSNLDEVAAEAATAQRLADEAEQQLAALTERQAAVGAELETCRVTLARREAAWEIAGEELSAFPEGLEVLESSERHCRTRLASVAAELEALGPVNHRAGQEYARERARYEELQAETTQASLAVTELQSTLERLERETTERLLREIHRLRQAFARHAAELLGGEVGADVAAVLEEGRPVGLRIELQPPGKATKQLNLLSVGERTMGAMAFLFALIDREGGLPVAVLDEVDAPLDEANIRRFCTFLRRLASRGTQFVLITHQKATFEVADVLWGVTTEQGVSRVFSIQRDDWVAAE